jgi:triacylglycerol lipase
MFRGTISSNSREWSQDFNLEQKTYAHPVGESSQAQVSFLQDVAARPAVHRGFLAGYEKLRPSLLHHLEQLKPDQVIVAGHSLGAGVGTICALDISMLGYNTVAYTFASPRVGDNKFFNLVNSTKLPLFRVVNTADIVPSMPPSVTPNFNDPEHPFIYTHCGTLIHFTDNWQSWVNNHVLPVYIKFLQT